MASKGQKFKEYDRDLKIKVAKSYVEDLLSYSQVAKIFKIDKSSVRRWVKLYLESPNSFDKETRGRIGGNPFVLLNNKNISRIKRLELELRKAKLDNLALKKELSLGSLTKENKRAIFEIIDSTKSRDISIAYMANYFGVSRDGYYKWKKRNGKLSKTSRRFYNLSKLVTKISVSFPSHGYRRINDKLYTVFQIGVSDMLIHKICKLNNIQSKMKNNWNTPGKQTEIYENIIKQKEYTDHYKLYSDATRINHYNGALEACIVMDNNFYLHSIEMVKYNISHGHSPITHLKSLENSIKQIKKNDALPRDIILHTDQGPVYKSRRYNSICEKYNIKRSMSRSGTPTDNAKMEGAIKLIKKELELDFNFFLSKNPQGTTDEFMNYWNNSRIIRSIDKMTPAERRSQKSFINVY